MRVVIFSDAVHGFYGGTRLVFFLGRTFMENGFDVALVTPQIIPQLQLFFEKNGFTVLNLNVATISKMQSTLGWLELWAGEVFFRRNSKAYRAADGYVALNFSHTLPLPSLVWYALGLVSDRLHYAERDFPLTYRVLYKSVKPVIQCMDSSLVRRFVGCSKMVVACSNFYANLCRQRGVMVRDVIYAPVDCEVFKPSTTSPTGDYVLAYAGVETKISLLKTLVDSGVRVKIFGPRAVHLPRSLVNHGNVEVFAYVHDSKLVDLYSNALYTLFPFNFEPFGYVPVESMACGTPVLTYNQQGPSETVIHNKTGWLVEGDHKLVSKAMEVWREGYSERVRRESRRRALEFDIGRIYNKWLRLIERHA